MMAVNLEAELKDAKTKLAARDKEIKRLRAALSWLCSEVEEDHKLGRLSVDSEQCAESARRVLTNE